ncbi:hypothetical protein QAD02_023088 [Eretmocerus hayati]|uniref:Uncharacterized protein n=1 Tax=Eretmocerus hayati TaxID=131215 RepID=A0ACC2PUM7_9HYME|nr:hypothetical protein QAD02_023088 [Eretmocerus hayati]
MIVLMSLTDNRNLFDNTLITHIFDILDINGDIVWVLRYAVNLDIVGNKREDVAHHTKIIMRGASHIELIEVNKDKTEKLVGKRTVRTGKQKRLTVPFHTDTASITVAQYLSSETGFGTTVHDGDRYCATQPTVSSPCGWMRMRYKY